jgi:hypothetical protein
MKQPKIHITDIHGKDFGIKKVINLEWNTSGKLVKITVDFMGEYRDLMGMYDIDSTDIFTNVHGNLKGELIFDL